MREIIESKIQTMQTEIEVSNDDLNEKVIGDRTIVG